MQCSLYLTVIRNLLPSGTESVAVEPQCEHPWFNMECSIQEVMTSLIKLAIIRKKIRSSDTTIRVLLKARDAHLLNLTNYKYHRANRHSMRRRITGNN